MLDVQGRGLVGFTAENVERRLVDRAFLQQCLPQDNDLYLVIGRRGLAEDNEDGGG